MNSFTKILIIGTVSVIASKATDSIIRYFENQKTLPPAKEQE